MWHITKACGEGSSMGQHIGIDLNLSFVCLIWGAKPTLLSFLQEKKSMSFTKSITETTKSGATLVSMSDLIASTHDSFTALREYQNSKKFET